MTATETTRDRHLIELAGCLELVERLVTEYETLRDDIKCERTVHGDPEAKRSDMDDAICEVVTDWVSLGEPDEFADRVRALPRFDKWHAYSRTDEETNEAFDALVGSEPAPEWDDAPPPEPDYLPSPASLDEAQIGAAFGEMIAGRYLYCRSLGGWLRWDGRRWKRDTTEAVFEEARKYVLDLGTEMLRTGADSKEIQRLAGFRSKGRIDSVVTIARRLEGIAAEADEFDRHPGLLVVANGTVDLRTGVRASHDPALRITKMTPVNFDPGARHDDVDLVLAVVDPEVRDWLQMIFGYAATGHVSEDLMVVFGGLGANGKTTLLEAVKECMGEYAKAAPVKLLMKSGNDEHPTLLADLFGRRLVTVEETAEGGSLRVETMKALTGGSSITARFMRADYFEFTPTHQLVVATNHLPAVNSGEHATWRRLRLVPFPHRYERPDRMRPGDRPVDMGLRARLKRPAQQRAMLAWVVAGAVRWHSEGLSDPAAVVAATDDWRRSEDVIHRFSEDRLAFDPDGQVGAADLFREYENWCQIEGRPAGSQKQFTKRFEDHDITDEHHVERTKTRTGRVWSGVQIR